MSLRCGSRGAAYCAASSPWGANPRAPTAAKSSSCCASLASAGGGARTLLAVRIDDFDEDGGVDDSAYQTLHIGATARDVTHESVAKLVYTRGGSRMRPKMPASFNVLTTTNLDILEDEHGIVKIDGPVVLLYQSRDDESSGENGTRPGPCMHHKESLAGQPGSVNWTIPCADSPADSEKITSNTRESEVYSKCEVHDTTDELRR